MGAVVNLHPAIAVTEQFTHLDTYDHLGPHELVLARSMVGGEPRLSILLMLNRPDGRDGDGFEILSSVRETPGTREALSIVARAVCLAAMHLLPGELL